MRIIAGEYKGRSLKTTTGPGFRPAMGKVREALFAMLDARGLEWSSCRVLDLFAGGGSLGFEALSRGATHVAFVESASYATKTIKANAQLLNITTGRYSVITKEVGKVISKPPSEPFNLVFIDPPYQLNALGRTINMLIKNNWLTPGSLVNAEVEERLKFTPATAHEALTLLEDRNYGQTRVILWALE